MTPGEKAAWNQLASFKWYRRQQSTLMTCLADIQLLEEQLPAVKQRLIDTLRDEGWSWDEIGEVLELTPGQARYRYG